MRKIENYAKLSTIQNQLRSEIMENKPEIMENGPEIMENKPAESSKERGEISYMKLGLILGGITLGLSAAIVGSAIINRRSLRESTATLSNTVSNAYSDLIAAMSRMRSSTFDVRLHDMPKINVGIVKHDYYRPYSGESGKYNYYV